MKISEKVLEAVGVAIASEVDVDIPAEVVALSLNNAAREAIQAYRAEMAKAGVVEVPREPTEAQIHAALCPGIDSLPSSYIASVFRAYKAMLTASGLEQPEGE